MNLSPCVSSGDMSSSQEITDVQEPHSIPCTGNEVPETINGEKFRSDFETLIEIKKGRGALGDDDDLFLFFEDEAPWRLELLRHYVEAWNFRYGKSCDSAEDYDRTIWFDNRDLVKQPSGSNVVRTYSEFQNPLIPSGLRRILKQKLLITTEDSDRGRSLIYATDPSPACIRALSVAASMRETSALRDIVTQYLAFHISILVRAHSYSLQCSYLTLHLPFFQLRRVCKREATCKTTSNPIRRRIDVSYLGLTTSKPEEQTSDMSWFIDQVQISISLTWSDKHWWQAIAFADLQLLGTLDLEDSPENILMDQLSARRRTADPPIWSLQEYYLQCVEIWFRKATVEWKYLIYMIENAVIKHNDEQHMINTREQTTQLKKASDSTSLLRQLHSVLLNTVKVLKAFASEDMGDIEYLEDYSEDR